MSNPDSGPDGVALLGIGAVAGLVGKRPSSIRYYEQIGLLPPPARVSGKRRYDAGTVRTLAVIDTAQRAGLTLDEIKELLAASPDDNAATARLRDLAARKLPQIAAQIERIELVRSWLECAARCQCPDLDECPLFDDPTPPTVAPRHSGSPMPIAAPRHRPRPPARPSAELRGILYP
jgi:MerR family transcriptional regulator, redox-sensitive transcriptional activator SoxR